MPLTIPPINSASQISFSSQLGLTSTNVNNGIDEVYYYAVKLAGTETITGTKTFSALTTFSNNTASSSTSTGALVVSGGVGIGGTSYINTLRVTSTASASNTTTGAFVSSGGIGIGGTSYINTLRVSNNTGSTSTTTGALVVTGGTGVGGNLYVGGNFNLTGTPTGLKSNTPTLITRRVAAQNFNSGAFTTILWDTSVNDSGSGLNLSTGVYTVPAGQGGIYFCAARIVLSSGCTRLLLEVAVNGTIVNRLSDIEVAGDTLTCASGSTALVLNAGDTVSISIFQTNTTSASRATNTVRNTHTEWSMFKLSTT